MNVVSSLLIRAGIILTLTVVVLVGSGVSEVHRAGTAAQKSEIYPLSLYRNLDFSPYEPYLSELSLVEISQLSAMVLEQPVSILSEHMENGHLTALELTLYYLYRIREYDLGKLNTVIDLNPWVLEEAAELDQERVDGTLRGPLHGIPVLLKDTIATDDYLFTSAGAAALAFNVADRDAFLVTQLRDAGALILGKTNLTEWSNWMHGAAANGYSAVGGQVVSPYGAWIDPSGSSSGSAAATTMNFAALTIGAETIGSIIAPAARSSVVGMKPSIGLISRDYVIPISDEIDTPGPIGRTVFDVAQAMNVLAGSRDLNDPLSASALQLISADFTFRLNDDALEGKRVGLFAVEPLQSDAYNIGLYAFEPQIEALEAAGAEVVVVRLPPYPDSGWGQLLACDMHHDVDEYLQRTGSELTTIEEIAAYNVANPSVMPFGQVALAGVTGCDMTEEEIAELGRYVRTTGNTYMDLVFESHGIDVLATVDDVGALEYALAGWPAVTVPRGLTLNGVPTGLTLIGPYLSDIDLLGYAFALELRLDARVLPVLATLGTSED